MQQMKTLLFSKSCIDLKLAAKVMLKETNFCIEGIYSDERSLLSELSLINPELVLILKVDENNNPESNKLIKDIKKNMPSIVIIVVCVNGQEVFMYEALSYLDTCRIYDNFNKVTETLRKLFIEKYFNKDIYEKYVRLLEQVRTDEILDSFELTDTEKKIFHLKKVGLTRNEIAAKRIISSDTVRNHTANILKKIGVRNTRDALVKINGIVYSNWDMTKAEDNVQKSHRI